ncbi:MAG: AAA family ATPase [Phycisphaerales bacterium]|nr:AAA family ATPase [Phycisphaerales bacterium]
MTDRPPDGDMQIIELAAAPPIAAVPPEQLRWRCDPASLPFASTAELAPVEGIVGQDSAVESLAFGLEVQAPGQNIFVRGLTGTGRLTLIRRMLETIRPSCPPSRDRCYVHNFAQPESPRLITLKRDQAPAFRRAIDELANFIRDDLPAALRSEAFLSKKTAREKQAQKEVEAVVAPFEATLRAGGLALVTVMVGPVAQAALFPIVEGQALTPEQWQELRHSGRITDDEAAEFRRKQEDHQEQLRAVMEEVNAIRSRHGEEIKELGEQEVRTILATFTSRIRAQFQDGSVAVFLAELIEDAAKHSAAEKDEDDYTRRYRVNVLISRGEGEGCPIIVECTPTMTNLLGSVERRFERDGMGRSDHTLIRPGAILRADGGFLVLDARDVLTEPGAWRVLVRTLKTGRLEIVPPQLSLPWWGPTLQPEPIDVNVKVVLLGDMEIHYLLDSEDADFPYLFKVLADFDSMIPRTPENVLQYGRVLSRIAQEENLAPFTNEAVAALVEHGARIAGRREKLTARFGRLADLAREAAFIAGREGSKQVRGSDVRQAVARTKRRADLPSRQFREYIADGTIKIAATGRAVGQVNGLAVLQAGPLTYGFPSRITATIGPGSVGVINIEREAELSGAIHTKGFYILGGLLRHLLRTHHPLAFHASIAFEQSYGGIDGDSASGAEMCCLLSALTDVPLRQDLAMTGAIDQVGNILAVGATNEKIEGFYDACRDLGLCGTQGVIIPKANAGDLMLREDVVEACREGRFHVYAVDHVRGALELLTGIRAGEPDDSGFYPDTTLLGLAVGRAYEYWVKASQNAPQFEAQPDESSDARPAERKPPSPPKRLEE